MAGAGDESGQGVPEARESPFDSSFGFAQGLGPAWGGSSGDKEMKDYVQEHELARKRLWTEAWVASTARVGLCDASMWADTALKKFDKLFPAPPPVAVPISPLQASFKGTCDYCGRPMGEGMLVDGKWMCPRCQDSESKGACSYYDGCCSDCEKMGQVRQVPNGSGPLCKTCYEKAKVRR